VLRRTTRSLTVLSAFPLGNGILGLETELRKEHFAELADEYGYDDNELPEVAPADAREYPDFNEYTGDFSEPSAGPFDTTADYH